jgi:hypothetical protein
MINKKEHNDSIISLETAIEELKEKNPHRIMDYRHYEYSVWSKEGYWIIDLSETNIDKVIEFATKNLDYPNSCVLKRRKVYLVKDRYETEVNGDWNYDD